MLSKKALVWSYRRQTVMARRNFIRLTRRLIIKNLKKKQANIISRWTKLIQKLMSENRSLFNMKPKENPEVRWRKFIARLFLINFGLPAPMRESDERNQADATAFYFGNMMTWYHYLSNASPRYKVMVKRLMKRKRPRDS